MSKESQVFFSGVETAELLPVETAEPLPVDGHAHVFTRRLPMAARRRYTPLGDASPSAYRALLAGSGLAGGVLVQPSFLGEDNRYLLEILRLARNGENGPCLRGVCVLPPSTSLRDIQKMTKLGVLGARLNLLERGAPNLRTEEWRRFLSAIDLVGWHLEICAEGGRLPEILDAVLPHCQNVIVDHFGMPAPAAPLKCRGFQAILRASPDQLRVKISAPYRVFPGLSLDAAADQCSKLSRVLRDQFGARRLIWGSDWPWTRYESGMTFATALRWRQQWLDGEQDGAADLLFDSARDGEYGKDW